MADFKFNNSLDNFEDIVQQLKDYFQTLNYTFVNGGNFDILMRLFAWHKMSTGQDISNIVNNLYLSSANNKESVFSLAKQLGYVVRRNIPSRVKCKLEFNGNISADFTANTIRITGKNNNYDFYAENVNFTLDETTSKYTAVFDCQQKTSKTFSYLGNGSKNQTITLPETTITDDDFTLSSSIGANDYVWELAQNYDVIPDSTIAVYFLQMSDLEQTVISFGNGIVGRIPQSNEVIDIEYYITEGELANNENSFSLTNIVVQSSSKTLNNISNYTLTTGTSFGYSGNESIEEIKTNAPRYFSNLGNNITRRDFENVLQVESEYVAYSNISNQEAEDSILSLFYFLLVPSNFINQEIIDASNNQTLPVEAIENLVVSTIEYSKFEKYFSDWIYLKIASPTYFYYEIMPQIRINQYKNFNSISNILQ